MLYIITGASGSGKTACLPYLQEALSAYTVADFDDIGVPENADKAWRQESTEKWLQHYLEQAKPMVICGGVIIGEIIACPSFAKIDTLKLCLLDCSDIVRIERLKKRGDTGINQHVLNWASWQRMHHNDPRWEQHVIKDGAWEGLDFSRLENAQSWDEIINPPICIDTSNRSIESVSADLSNWIQESENG